MIQIWLDDIREAPDSTWKVFRDAEALISFLQTYKGDIACISLDHDLGEDKMSGYDAIAWIEEQVALGRMAAPHKMFVHSANPVGAKRISQAIANIQRLI